MYTEKKTGGQEQIDLSMLSPDAIYRIAIGYFCCFYENKAKDIVSNQIKLHNQNRPEIDPYAVEQTVALDMTTLVPHVLLRSIEDVFNCHMHHTLEKNSYLYVSALRRHNENVTHDALFRDSIIRASDITEQSDLLMERAYLVERIFEKLRENVKTRGKTNPAIWAEKYKQEALFNPCDRTYIVNTVAEAILILQKYTKNIDIDDIIHICLNVYENEKVLEDFDNKTHIVLAYLTIIRRIVARAENAGQSIHDYVSNTFHTGIVELFTPNDTHYILRTRVIDGKSVDPLEMDTPLDLIRVVFDEN